MAGGAKIWIDAQLSPILARWLAERFGVGAVHISELNLVNASDPAIFDLARGADAIVLTKDRDFVELGSSPWNAAASHLDHLREYIEPRNAQST